MPWNTTQQSKRTNYYTYNNLDESMENYTELKKKIPKGSLLYVSINVTSLK